MTIPTLLAGQIIRRVEPPHVFIWLATSEAFDINAAFYQMDSDEELSTCSETTSIQAGENLHIHLVKITPNDGTFPVDKLLGYNLFFSNEFDLGSLNLLSPENPHSIVYGNLAYPTFFIQKNTPANILYGSCRKPHGKGNDMLLQADSTIQKNPLNPDERPGFLFLMGDQIYADDVADSLFHVISTYNKLLIGEHPNMFAAIDPRLASDSFQPDKIHARTMCGFTSGNAANHLIRFGEYAVMYLLTLGPALWEKADIPLVDELLENDAYYFMFSDAHKKQHAKELKKHRNRYYEQLKAVLPFIKTLSNVRRVLANTQTYMIFDDHDITDDWNISDDWKNRVWNAPLGRHTIAHGLTAYWLFQGWGKRPGKHG